MRTLTKAMLAIVIFLCGGLTATDAEAQAPTSVDCTMFNGTDPSIKNPDGSYPLDTPVNLQALITDPSGIVAGFDWVATSVQSSGIFQTGPSDSATWTWHETSEWLILAIPYDAAGDTIQTTGDCDVNIRFSAVEGTNTIECALNQSVASEHGPSDGEYPVNTPVELTVNLSDQGNQVARIVISAYKAGSLSRDIISDGTDTTAIWTQAIPGTWITEAQLYDATDNLLTHKGNCTMIISFYDDSEEPPVTTPTTPTVPETTPTTQQPPVIETPTTVTEVSNESNVIRRAAPSTTAPAALPRTGPSTQTTMQLLQIGFCLISLGGLLMGDAMRRKKAVA